MFEVKQSPIQTNSSYLIGFLIKWDLAGLVCGLVWVFGL